MQLVTSSELNIIAVVSVGFGTERPNLKFLDFGPINNLSLYSCTH